MAELIQVRSQPQTLVHQAAQVLLGLLQLLTEVPKLGVQHTLVLLDGTLQQALHPSFYDLLRVCLRASILGEGDRSVWVWLLVRQQFLDQVLDLLDLCLLVRVERIKT
mmetsp:Transcript_22351/g.34604  ORF Transcript_22351/g.34604 Transcript_22351/m.34604 type:complete len:108 (-) Transcript_22351:1121-1444(-)